jgi:hypothetical protein
VIRNFASPNSLPEIYPQTTPAPFWYTIASFAHRESEKGYTAIGRDNPRFALENFAFHDELSCDLANGGFIVTVMAH